MSNNEEKKEENKSHEKCPTCQKVIKGHSKTLRTRRHKVSRKSKGKMRAKNISLMMKVLGGAIILTGIILKGFGIWTISIPEVVSGVLAMEALVLPIDISKIKRAAKLPSMSDDVTEEDEQIIDEELHI